MKQSPIATARLQPATSARGQRDGGPTSISHHESAESPDLERELSTLDRTNASMTHRALDCDLPQVTELTRMLDVQLARVRHGTLALSAARVSLMQQASGLLARVIEAHFDGHGVDTAVIASIRSILDTVALAVPADSAVARRARTRRGMTVSGTGKWCLAAAGALIWIAIVAALAWPWLASLTRSGIALTACAGLAMTAGLIHAFLLIGLALSRRRQPVPLNHYPPLSILIPINRNATPIEATLHSIAMQRYPGRLDVILVAADSVHASLAPGLLNQYPWLGWVSAPTATSQAELLNHALKFTKGSLVLTLAADCGLSPDSLQSMVNCFFP